jgi:tetratricopeptide (TPR) repeat protein
MPIRRVIFVSAVSREFHSAPPEQRHNFPSYRDVLDQAFRTLAPNYEVIVQENLVQGMEDLLETLDSEVARSLVVIHLIGNMAGEEPPSASVRNLHIRHPDFLLSEPELKDALVGSNPTYTQWEIYLAFHHRTHRLIFEALPEASRSPFYAPSEVDRTSQEHHRQRISATGAHRGHVSSQGDVARKTMRSFLHRRLDPDVDATEPTEEALTAAWANRETIVRELADAIRKPDPRTMPVTDPANVAAFVGAVRLCAGRWNLNLATVLSIAARHEETVRAAAESHPSPEALYESAFAELALGDLTAAQHMARRAAMIALQVRQEQPEDDSHYREIAVNALLLAHDASKLAHEDSEALAVLREAAALFDRETDSLRWAGVNQQLAEFLVDQAHYNEASELIGDILKIREELEGDNHQNVADVLLLSARVLFAQANFAKLESVAERAERIYGVQEPPNFSGIADALSHRVVSLTEERRFSEGEVLANRSLDFTERAFGSVHPDVATSLANLAAVLQHMNRFEEAKPLLWRALAILEQEYGEEHPRLVPVLNNLAQLFRATGVLDEAEVLTRRALTTIEEAQGPEHVDAATLLDNLADLLFKTGHPDDAEALVRRSIAIFENSYGFEHPRLAEALMLLAWFLRNTNRPQESKILVDRALLIRLKFAARTPSATADLSGALKAYANLSSELHQAPGEIFAGLMRLCAEASLDRQTTERLFRSLLDESIGSGL